MPYRRTLSQPVMLHKREDSTERAEAEHKEELLCEMAKAAVTVRATTVNSLHPTLEYDLLPLNDSTDCT